MTLVANAERELNQALTELFKSKGADYADSGVPEIVGKLFKGFKDDGSFKLDKIDTKYRLRKTLTTAAAPKENDPGVTVNVISISELAKGSTTVGEALAAKLYDSSGLVAQFTTDGLFGEGVSATDLENDLNAKIHDHTMDGILEDAVQRTFGQLLLTALKGAGLGDDASTLLTDTATTLLRVLVLACIAKNDSIRERCVGALLVAPGALLLGRNWAEGEKKKKTAVKDGAPCYVIAA